MIALPNPFAFSNSPEFTPLSVDTAAAAWLNAPAPVAAAEQNPGLAPSAVRGGSSPTGSFGTPGRKDQALNSEPREAPLPTETSAGGKTMPPAAFSDDDCISELVRNATYYTPEYFSDYAHRRSMAIVSPNHGQREPREFEPDFDAMYDYIVPPEPPIFLRKPSPAFLRSLFQIAGVHL